MRIKRPRQIVLRAATAFGLMFVCVPLFAADPAPPAATTSAPSSETAASPSAVPTPTPDPARLSLQVLYFRQIKALSLTPGQIQDFAGRLARLTQMDRLHAQKVDKATQPVLAQLSRLEAAALAGQTPNPADQAAVDKALNPLRPEEDQIAALRRDTVTAIREALSAAQLDAVKTDLGIVSPPPSPQGNGGRGGQPGQPGQAAATGQTAPGGQTGQPAFQRGGAFGGAGNAPQTPQDLATRMMDRFRQIPPNRYDRFKDRMADGMARMMGVQRNSPQFDSTKQSLLSEMQQIRQMPPNQYQQTRSQIANSFVQQYPAFATAAAARINGQASVAAQRAESTTDLDDAAVQRFFLTQDAMTYLSAHVGK